MLRAYGPDCHGEPIGGPSADIPAHATWIDLESPTVEEEALVERKLGLGVPTREEMSEIEPSSRLYEKDNALYMTLGALTGIEEGKPRVTPISFLLTDSHLVTIRYATPKPFRLFGREAADDPLITGSPISTLLRLLDSIVERLADELEEVGRQIDAISTEIFCNEDDARRIAARRLTALLSSIGRTQSLLARIRETAVSTARLITFLDGSGKLDASNGERARERIGSIARDVTSLIDHSAFLADNLTFLLDASLGLISVEQNAAMKLFSWAALVFLPPTLIAGIYGMNFRVFPELNWPHGYPMALALMLASAVLPMAYLKFRRWI